MIFAHDDGSQPWELGVYDKSSGGIALLTDDGHNLNPTLPFASIDGLNIAYTDSYPSGAHGGNIALGRLVAPSFRAGVSSSLPAFGAKVTIGGSLADNGIPLGNVALTVERSTNGGHTWSNVGAPSTNAAGDFSFVTPANYVKSWYRVRYAGALYYGPTYPDHLSATSSTMMVVPRAALGKPTGYPSTGRKTKTYSVYGSLKPRQAVTAASAKVVVIQCYRKQKGKYVLRKTVSAKVYNYGADSRYRGGVKLPYTGKWRLRAYFKGTGINAEKYSSYRYVYVK